MLFNKYLADLVVKLHEKGQITRKSQKIYISILGFYKALKFLRDHGLIRCDGVTEKNMKIWVLTEKGKKLANHILEIRKIFGVKVD